MLLTRLPLGIATSFDLHVLGTPPALVLSQDQTLHKKFYGALKMALKIRVLFSEPLAKRFTPRMGASRNCTCLAMLKDIALRRSLKRRRPTDLCAAALFSFQGASLSGHAIHANQ